MKEADIRPYDDRATAYVQMMEERAAPMRAKVCPVDVDSDPGMAHFKIPKLQSLKLATCKMENNTNFPARQFHSLTLFAGLCIGITPVAQALAAEGQTNADDTLVVEAST
ncbi:DUF968 domain-containing protein, partial [Escherichia coli]|uniref:DUF968 domain-containing protein n=1 Tax=Escherichia coli TaxID=562 RepID=UPI003F50C7D9